MSSWEGPTGRHGWLPILLCALVMAGPLGACGPRADPELLPSRLDELPGLAGRTVVVMKPDVRVREVYPGALMELNAEWTTRGEDYVVKSLRRRLKEAEVETVAAAEIESGGAGDPRQTQLTRLHAAVVSGILSHHYESFASRSSPKLPTKENSFDWSLGTEARFLREKYQADYALFVAFYDNYSSGETAGPETGFIAKLQKAMAEFRWGYASLVELESGRIVWFAKRKDEGVGVRTQWQAGAAVDELLKDFPG